MYVGYMPEKASRNDFFLGVLNLGDLIQGIMRQSRRHPSARNKIEPYSESSLCGRCGSWGMEAHHIKPVWALATECILRNQPCDNAEAYAVYTGIFDSNFDFSPWHNESNIKILCKVCHLHEQKIDDRLWKYRLARDYPVVFTMRWADEYIRKQFRQFKDVTARDYFEQYRVKYCNNLEKQLFEIVGLPYD